MLNLKKASKRSVALTLSSNINSTFKIINKIGKNQKITAERIYDSPNICGESYRQLVLFNIPFKGYMLAIFLKYGDNNFSTVLPKVGANTVRNTSNVSRFGNTEVIVFPFYDKDKLAGVAIRLTDLQKNTSSFSIERIILTDVKGTEYTLSHADNTHRVFLYNAKYSDQLCLEISDIAVIYKDASDAGVVEGLWHINLKY